MKDGKIVFSNNNIDIFEKLKNKAKENPDFRLSLLSNYYCNIFNYVIKRNEESIWYYGGNYKINSNDNNNLYLKLYKKEGFVYDFKSKKITIWFGTNLTDIETNIILSFLDEVGCDWFSKLFKVEPYSLISIKLFLKKTIIEKIINKKINNPKELLIEYCKTSLRYTPNNWKEIRDILSQRNLNSFVYNSKNIFKWTTNPFQTINNLITKNINFNCYNTILNYYAFIGKKINMHLWSENRFLNEIKHVKSQIINARYKCLNSESILPFNLGLVENNNIAFEVINNEKDLYHLCRTFHKNSYDSFNIVKNFTNFRHLFVKVIIDKTNVVVFRLSLINRQNEETHKVIDKYNLYITPVLYKEKENFDFIEEIISPYKSILLNFFLMSKNHKDREICYVESTYSSPFQNNDLAF